MNIKIIRVLSSFISAAMLLSAVPSVMAEENEEKSPLFSMDNQVRLFGDEAVPSGRMMYNDFEAEETGDYSNITVTGPENFSVQVVSGDDANGKDGKVLRISKKDGVTGDITKEKLRIGSKWTWGESAGHTVITSFSVASAKADSSNEQITYAIANNNSAVTIAGSFRMSKGKFGFGKCDGTTADPKDYDISGSSYGTEWHNIAMVSQVNDDNQISLTEYYLDGEKVDDFSCVPKDVGKQPTIFRMNFDAASSGTTTYVDDIAVIDINQELNYLDSIFKSDAGISTTVINGKDSIVLPEHYKGATVKWTSNDNSIIDVENMADGIAAVTHTGEQKTVKLTAQLTYTGVKGHEIEGISVPSQVTHDFDVVVEQSGELTDEQKAERLKAALEIASEVSGDFTLPLTVSNDSGIEGTVAWTSDNEAIAVDGANAKVTRPAYNMNDRDVALTAKITVGSATVEKKFTVKVLKNEIPVTEDEKISYALDRLLALSFSEDTEKVVSSSINLPTEITLNDSKIATIVWTSSDLTWMSNTGSLLKAPTGSTPKELTLTAVITAGGKTETKVFPILIRSNASVKAFPGAQGYGTQTRGGAGGYIVHVTSLGATGPGTLYEALEQKKGARTIVFDVGGTIDLTPLGRALRMSGEDDSNVTIAGQTAPGDGIQLKGYGITLSSVHDVIIRHISIRIGNVRKAGDTYQSDPLSATGANKRVVLDHLSMCWGVDMGFRIYGQEMTMSNCMVSKGLYWNTPHEKGQHNYAGIFGAKYGTFYGNYIADCGQRAPRICDNEFIDIRNNVVFNSKYTFDICNYEWMGANPKYNIVNNMVLKGNTAPAGSSSNTTEGGSYKYFQGRTYSGGLFTYSVNNYDNTKYARPLNDRDVVVDGALWTGDVSEEEKEQIKKELYAFSATGYSNMSSQWFDMILPNDVSLDEYDESMVSKKGNTLVNYPFAVPSMKTYSTKEAVKYVLENAGAKAPVRGILDNRYLAEGRTRLQILSDYSKASQSYGIKLDMDYEGETAYGLPVSVHTVYTDENGMTVYDVDGNNVTDASNMEIKEQYKFVSCENSLDTLYAIDKNGKNKYRLELRPYEDEDDIYDAFELYDINNNKLEKPNPYVSESESTDGMHYPNGIVLKFADWGDGAGNYDHGNSSVVDGNLGTELVDTEWTADDWPQLPTVYRDGKFDSNGDGIPDEFIKLMGWDKHPDYSSTKDISRLDFEGRGYTNLEYYINDYCAGDMESEDSEENDPIQAENVRDGSSKYDTHKNHEVLFNTVRRAKAKLYYNEGEVFDMDTAKEISLNKEYDYASSKYSDPNDFETYFSAIISDLKPNTTYSYKIKTYSDKGVECISSETYNFTTKSQSTGKPDTPRVIKYIPFDKQITIQFEPGSTKKTYKQELFPKPGYGKDGKDHRLTTIGFNDYDTKTDHYILRYSTDKDFSDTKEIEIPATLTKYVLKDLSNDNEYYIDLRAVSGDGTESDSAIFNLKKAEKLEGQTDKDGNDVYGVKSIEIKGGTINEYYSGNDVNFDTIPIQPTLYVVNENYPKSFKDPEINIQEGETTKFITVYGDVKDWYIYTLGGIPIPTSYQNEDPMLMLRDDSHDHGFTYAKKFDTLLDGRSTIHAKIMIHDEELDPMNQAPEFRFYIQQDSADSEDTEAAVDSTSENQATAFGNIVTLQFTKNEVIFNGTESIFRYSDDVWYDIKLLMDADTGTCSLYINDSLIGKDMEYSEAATSNSIARWQISSRLAGTEDVYIEYMYAYKGWDEPVTDPTATQKPSTEVGEGTSGKRPAGGGGGGGGIAPTATVAPTSTQEPAVTAAPGSNGENPDNKEDVKSGFIDMDGYEWAEEAVNELHNRNIAYGITEELFAPGREITRAEFVTLLMRGFELIGEDATCNFEDVPDGAWYYPAVAMAYSMGIVSGYDTTTFGANDKVSRQDMAAMVVRLISKLGFDLPKSTSYEGFADDFEIADYARDAVIKLYESGIINGVGENRFDPKGTANRAATAKILYSTLKIQWDKQEQ